MAQGRLWTDAEEQWLIEAIDLGLGRVEICESLNRNPDVVRRKCHRLGVKFPEGEKPAYEDRVFEQPPSAIAFATTQLGKAIRALMERMDPLTLTYCLGKPPAPTEPGTENFLRGQLAERRLAA